MLVNDVLQGLMIKAGIGGRELSRRLGKAETWASNSVGRVPRLDTVADVADVAGVDVVLIDRETGDVVGVVEPPRRRG